MLACVVRVCGLCLSAFLHAFAACACMPMCVACVYTRMTPVECISHAAVWLRSLVSVLVPVCNVSFSHAGFMAYLGGAMLVAGRGCHSSGNNKEGG